MRSLLLFATIICMERSQGCSSRGIPQAASVRYQDGGVAEACLTHFEPSYSPGCFILRDGSYLTEQCGIVSITFNVKPPAEDPKQ